MVHNVLPTDVTLGHQARLSTTDSSRHCLASGELRLPAGALGRWMPRGGKEEGGGKEGLSGEVTCCPSLEKDRMMDGP